MATSILAHSCALPNRNVRAPARAPRQHYQRYDLVVDAEVIDGELRRGIVPPVPSISAEPQELALWVVL